MGEEQPTEDMQEMNEAVEQLLDKNVAPSLLSVRLTSLLYRMRNLGHRRAQHPHR